MTDRTTLADMFLAKTSWAHARRTPLAGDASARKYERLIDPNTGQTAVLMDAPTDKGEDIRPFIRITEYLRNLGLSAPEIIAQDTRHGFLLLEDLGDALFARVLKTSPDLEQQLYETATDVLVSLHQASPPQLDPYSPAVMADLANLALSKYARGITGQSDIGLEGKFIRLFGDILQQTTQTSPVLIQRDYHAENLLWLPDRPGLARVGLLDFQDAMSGHPAYDLVSLLQDARRDVSPEIEQAMITRYIDKSGCDDAAFRTAYAVLGAQRNLRIIGVFARLGTEHDKPHYVDLIPRVWTLLMRDLVHSALAPVADLILPALPKPGADNLKKLK